MIESGQISALELKQRLDRKDPLVLLDVREKYEWDHCRIEGATLIPLSEITTRAKELQMSDEIVTYCHHGRRSQEAAQYLRQLGFTKVINLTGGIQAWSTDVDSSVPQY